MSRTLQDLIQDTAQALERAGIPNPTRDARLLVAAACGIAPDKIVLRTHEAASLDDHQHLGDLLADRVARKPLSHVLGYRDFFDHRFDVTPDVLDPRPETETLVTAALGGPVNRVIDLGTGSGAILISILAARPRAQGIGTDLSAAALEVAQANATRIGVADRARFVVSDWWAAIEGEADLIVSNPPYIAADEMADLAPELGYEPRMALTDEADGLMAYRAITAGARQFLRPSGRLMVEIGWTQGPEVAAMFARAGLDQVSILPDLDGRDRVVVGQNPA